MGENSAMTPELAAKYATPVPRYTSYPTAPHFKSAIDAAAYRDWLTAADPNAPLSLYLHIPFCDSLCWFCGCHTRIVNRYDPIAGYLAVLGSEIDLVAEALGAPRPVSHIHFGGGSPNMIAPDDFRSLLDRLRRRFALAPGAEIAVEIDPRGMTSEGVDALARAGVTRASLGVQDFDPTVQRAINRIQPFDKTAGVVGMLRNAGIGEINIDLIYGLPFQTEAGIIETVEKVLLLEPQRVAVFGYAHVPWMKRHQRLIDETALPDAPARSRQSAAAAARLKAAGYIAVGLDHFARADDSMARALGAGRLRRNFQGYTTDAAAALIGLGVSAIGSLAEGYVQNVTTIKAYREAIGKRRFAIERGLALDDDDRLRRDIIERLMCDLAVDLGAVCRKWRASPDNFAAELAALRPMEEDGLVKITGRRIRVTEAGHPLVRAVCAVFDRYLDTLGQRHSQAV
jgi:oxygen-independent coproporphyrinogen-3 oxidase